MTQNVDSLMISISIIIYGLKRVKPDKMGQAVTFHTCIR
jgi:hypothetical protein